MCFSKFKSWVAGLLVLALVGCGGGGGGGDPVLGGGGGGGGASTAASVDVSASGATLGDGESTITVTAIVKNASNVGMANTAVVWSTTAGSLTGTTTTTDNDGKAQAVFSATDRSAGTATITATSGSANGNVQVALQSSRTVVITPNKTEVGTDGDTVILSAIVKDAGNVAISGAAVTWSTTVGSLSGQTSVTNASGVATAIYSPGSTFSVPTTNVTVRSGTASATVPLTIRATTTSIEMLASSPSIGTGGDQVTISAFVKDANNIARVGVPVQWSVDAGGLVPIPNILNPVTDNNGLARATLDAGSNKNNRTAVVTVRAGLAVQTLSVPVVGTRLAFSGATTAASGSTLALTFTAADSKQVAIPGVVLTLSSALGNGVPPTVTTDAAGQASVQYVATRAGSDTISVAGAGASLNVAMTVTGTDEDLAFTAPGPSTQVVVNTVQPLTIRYRRAGVPQPNVDINVAATIGILSAGRVTTDVNGLATVTVRSTFAGTSMLSATLAGSAVQATLPLSFIATTPANLVLQVTPTALAPNQAGSTAQQATLVAKVIDVNGNPVAGSTINFSQVADPSGGLLQQASAVTDTNGVATVQYLSGATTTANNAVQLKATVASNAAVSGTASMTVNQAALFIALGTGNTITNFNPETYEKNWTVYVTDATGVRVPGVPVTIKVIPNYFAKGNLVWSETASVWIYESYRECLNEDRVNQNGVLDPGEDTNGDGTLTPGNVVALTASTVTTDSNGSATITMRYAELFASWIGVRLTATAIVAGTEATSFKDFPLDKLAGDYSVKTVAPAGVRSPFGIDVSTCTNAQ
jgi:hypothetical protein